MANTCAICGASINIFQSQKLADGNYLCRKVCCKKALKYFDFVNATLPEYQVHVAQVERGTKIWEQLFGDSGVGKNIERRFDPVYVAPELGLMALVETRYRFLFFGASQVACVYRIDDLVGYEMEQESKTVDGKQQTEYFVHYAFRRAKGMADFRVKYERESLCKTVEIYVNNLFGIQKTLGNSLNNWRRQKNAIQGVASAIGAMSQGQDVAEAKADAALDALDVAIYGDRSALTAKADAALAAFPE